MRSTSLILAIGTLSSALICLPGFVLIADPIPTMAATVDKDINAQILLCAIPGTSYRCEPYLKLAAMLQNLTDDACDRKLRELADHGHVYEVGILCRMLFSPKAIDFIPYDKAYGDTAEIVGGATALDFPQVPICLVDHVPFCVVSLIQTPFESSIPARPSSFVDRFISMSTRTTFKYSLIGKKEKTAALDKLLASKIWRRKLLYLETEFFVKQVGQ